MADVVILVPRRAGVELRDRLWTYVRGKLDLELGEFPVVEGDHTFGPFNRSAALNRAARKAELLGNDWRIAVLLDADTYLDPIQVRAAIERADTTGRLVLAYDVFVSLSRLGTEAIVDHRARTDWIEFARYEKPNAVSSCLAVRRDLWERARGFDERFEGWGFEDRAFFETGRTLAGAERIPGHAWHLWHPRSSEKDPKSETFIRNRELAEQYRAATGNVDAILELVNSR